MKYTVLLISCLFWGGISFSAIADRYPVRSGGSIVAPADAEIITDQQGLDTTLTEVSGEPDPTVEGIWVSEKGGIYYVPYKDGFVSMDDWGDMDADALMEAYVRGAKEQSELIGEKIEVLGWGVSPSLSKDKAVAYYAVKARFGDEDPIMNMVVYKLGRYGYEEITYAADPVMPEEAEKTALILANSFEFGENATYSDFKDGDKVAAIGAAGLLAGAFGVKFGKAGLIAMALVFFKKFWFLILIPFVGILGYIKRRFSRA
ncbi:DUF2167 domain-containing protein [Kiloniella majae]|uniref:DUF2167 domain-containing protein n=1 Tax=Kiloniella majae TaxID=1938558 RepID=UPI000A27770C|nr:DUF2167 domain-containing protein [Kiloniella majae]